MSTEKDLSPETMPWYDALRNMLAPYKPADMRTADKYFSTAEIASALEMHYLVPADVEPSPINGLELVETLHDLGYSTGNIAGLGLHWLMKKK